MSSRVRSIQPYLRTEIDVDRNWIERIILKLADAFNIRVVWDRNTALLGGTFALAGTLLGGYAGGRMGAAVGAGIGGVTGVGVSTVVSLRAIWSTVRDKLQELVYIVINYLRRIDPVDYVRAFDILMACTASRRELVLSILDFIVDKLGKQVISSITAA